MTKTMHKKLRELLIAYPDLPIVAIVYSEVVADDGIADRRRNSVLKGGRVNDSTNS